METLKTQINSTTNKAIKLLVNFIDYCKQIVDKYFDMENIYTYSQIQVSITEVIPLKSGAED